jgi:hypothetical protein
MSTHPGPQPSRPAVSSAGLGWPDPAPTTSPGLGWPPERPEPSPESRLERP